MDHGTELENCLSENSLRKKPFYIQKGNLYAVPVCHYQAEFAVCVRKAFLEICPDIVAVELPSALEESVITAVQRFPYISVIFYQTGKGEYVYFPVEPTDPLAEAVRSGLEAGVEVCCVDHDSDEYPLIFDPMPDSYAVRVLGLETYYKLYRETVESGEHPDIVTREDEVREEFIAYQLRRLLGENKKVLFVGGMVHIDRIMKKVEGPCARPIVRAEISDLTVFNLSLNSIREVTGEIPFVISAYEMLRGGHDPEKEAVDYDGYRSSLKEEPEGEVRLERSGGGGSSGIISFEEMRDKLRGREQLRDEVTLESGAGGEDLSSDLDEIDIRPPGVYLPVEIVESGEVIPEELLVSGKLDGLESEPVAGVSRGSPLKKLAGEAVNAVFQSFMKKLYSRLFSVPDSEGVKSDVSVEQQKLDFDNWLTELGETEVIRKEQVHKFKNCEDRGGELLFYYRDLGVRYPELDRQSLILELLKRSARFYEENVNEEIAPWQFRVFATFARNYARITGQLLPGLYQLVTCAKSCADDNYAYEVWDLSTFYPWIDYSGNFRTIDIHADEVWLYGKKITLRRKLPCYRKRLMRLPFSERKNEKRPGEWAEKFDDAWICSYPPDDIVIEDYGLFLRKKGMRILSEERTRVQPFTTSLLDGLDIRETLRNWHEKKLYVREHMKLSGSVGSTVVIFDDDPDNSRYPWKLTWLGEHHQESDMALYATRPHDKIIGPGISRCSYGGFMMTYPPGRVYDVWSDPFYSSARTKSEVLLMSAVEYSQETNIVYVAAKPPRSYFQSFAGRLGKRIVYLPIGSLSPVTLKKIRVFHVLAGHRVREFAKEYIW